MPATGQSETTENMTNISSDQGLVSKILFFSFELLPKNFLSFLLGLLSRIPWPGPVGRAVNWLFVTIFSIDMSEAEMPLASYATIEDVFSRRLKKEARPIEPPLCMPCDGTFNISGPVINGDQAVQVKGITYSLSTLVAGEDAAASQLSLGWFGTIYLAPSNYHRVHTPIAGVLKSVRYIPGDLWPVNPPFVKIVPALFNKNERMVFEIGLDAVENAKVYIVMVGALNVGRIRSDWCSPGIANSWERQLTGAGFHKVFAEPPELAVGDELGAFLLGSTTVMVFDNLAADAFELPVVDTSRTVRLGQPLA